MRSNPTRRNVLAAIGGTAATGGWCWFGGCEEEAEPEFSHTYEYEPGYIFVAASLEEPAYQDYTVRFTFDEGPTVEVDIPAGEQLGSASAESEHEVPINSVELLD